MHHLMTSRKKLQNFFCSYKRLITVSPLGTSNNIRLYQQYPYEFVTAISGSSESQTLPSSLRQRFLQSLFLRKYIESSYSFIFTILFSSNKNIIFFRSISYSSAYYNKNVCSNFVFFWTWTFKYYFSRIWIKMIIFIFFFIEFSF